MDLPLVTCEKYLKLGIFKMSKLHLTLIWPTKYLFTKYLLSQSATQLFFLLLPGFGLGLDFPSVSNPTFKFLSVNGKIQDRSVSSWKGNTCFQLAKIKNKREPSTLRERVLNLHLHMFTFSTSCLRLGWEPRIPFLSPGNLKVFSACVISTPHMKNAPLLWDEKRPNASRR